MSNPVVISGTGLWTPPHAISNEELVTAYNAHADLFNTENAAAIEAGEVAAKVHSSAEFIEKASGIKNRFAYIKDGILDINRLCPNIPKRADDELSDQAEMGVHAARLAMAAANKTAADIDAIIVSCTYTQRSYPAIAVEIQNALGVEGFAFDMLVACSAATFGIHRAYEIVAAGTAKTLLVINPELTSPQCNWGNRDSHFIFGDVSVATVVESAETSNSDHRYEILSTKALTRNSNNIRSNFGFVDRANDSDPYSADRLFHQNGRKVFKEVCPMVANHITEHLQSNDLGSEDVSRWWLHQANINMNSLIGKKLLGRDATPEEAPIVLDRYANTASAGSLIAFNLYHEDLVAGDYGVICSFGAGYSIGSMVVRKV